MKTLIQISIIQTYQRAVLAARSRLASLSYAPNSPEYEDAKKQLSAAISLLMAAGGIDSPDWVAKEISERRQVQQPMKNIPGQRSATARKKISFSM